MKINSPSATALEFPASAGVHMYDERRKTGRLGCCCCWVKIDRRRCRRRRRLRRRDKRSERGEREDGSCAQPPEKLDPELAEVPAVTRRASTRRTDSIILGTHIAVFFIFISFQLFLLCFELVVFTSVFFFSVILLRCDVTVKKTDFFTWERFFDFSLFSYFFRFSRRCPVVSRGPDPRSTRSSFLRLIIFRLKSTTLFISINKL